MFGSKQRKIDNLTEAIANMEFALVENITIAQIAIFIMEGCIKHPSYRVVRKPTADCEDCRKLFKARDLLDKSNTAKTLGYVSRTGKRGPNKTKVSGE